MHQGKTRAKLTAILSAALFGISAPLSKQLLEGIDPVPMAAFLYLGSGLGLMVLQLVLRQFGSHSAREAGLTRKDLPWLIGAIASGGIAAPILLMISLKHTPATTASLLLNFEAPATAIIAFTLFRESIGKRLFLAILAITSASILLSLETGGEWGFSLGALGILLSCFLWGMDNNLTRVISARDPLVIVSVKGTAAGVFSLILALLLGQSIPGLTSILLSMGLGFVSYGLSIVLFIHAMRSLGAAQTSAFFGAAPFIGVLVGFGIFQEPPDWRFLASLPLMLFGAFLILDESHRHAHLHGTMTHTHRHSHEDGQHTHHETK